MLKFVHMNETIIWTMITIFVLAMFGVFKIRIERSIKRKKLLEQRIENQLKEIHEVTQRFKRLVDGVQNMDRDEMDR
jgi:cell division protein FtsB